MSAYQIGQKVTGVVERVLSFGVFVRLDDNTRAFIRPRELDLDAAVEPSEVVHEGDEIAAVVVSLAEPDKHIELSRRAILPDPWPDFRRRFRKGDVVRGTVRSLTPHGVHIRILPGVSGFVPRTALATWEVAKPEKLLWPGDNVEAVITRMAPRSRRVGLSIKARLEQHDRALELFEQVYRGPIADAVSHSSVDKITALKWEGIADRGVAERVGHILVVDDHTEVRTSLVEWLSRRGFDVSQAGSLSEAISQMRQEDCRVLLLDLNLVDGDGLEIIQHIRENGNHVHIGLMSSPDFLIRRVTEIEAAGIAGVFAKPFDVSEIGRFLLRLGRGEPAPMWRTGVMHESNEETTFQVLSTIQRVDVSPLRRLQAALADVAEPLDAQVGLIFFMDPTSGAISVLAQTGKVTLNLDALYGLKDSPVEDVIHDRVAVLENHVTRRAQAKFSKLLDLLPFESCIGVPIQVQDEIHHAAFFFHHKPKAFSSYRLRDARAGALLFAALLEQDAINQRLQSLSPLLQSGALAAGFGHEVFNKIQGLELQLRNLLPVHGRGEELQGAVTRALELALDLKGTIQIFQQTLQHTEDQVTVDVNAVIECAERLLRPVSRKERVKVAKRLASDLPPVAGNPIALQQVFLNIMLNAVQQMAEQHTGRRILEISTALDREDAKSVQVRFADTGPGIHKRLWEKIFAPGFSTRGSSGLGLYIARSFVQSFGGKIQVEESFIPLGTTFLVELPHSSRSDSI